MTAHPAEHRGVDIMAVEVGRRAILAASAGFVLGACTRSIAPPAQFPEITFTHKPPLTLLVQRIEVVETYRSPKTPPHVEHRFPTTPAQGLRRWVQDRLRAEGSGVAVARFEILDAGVTETKLARAGGIPGVFKDEQSERYDAAAEAVLRINESDRGGGGEVKVRVSRARSIAESATANERDKFWFQLTEQLLAQFDQDMEAVIRAELAPFVV